MQQCGNPMMPTFWILTLFLLTWYAGYILNPIAKHKHEYTWVDVMKVRFGRMEGTHFSLYRLIFVLSLVLFSLTEEDGNVLTT